MAIDHLGKDLEALGVSGGDLRCLLLLPQIYVGWSSATRDVPVLEALLDTTARRARFHSDCADRARGWLFERPTRAQFQSGFALLRVLRRATPEPSITSSDVLEAMLWAVRAAKVVHARPTASAREELPGSDVWRALNDLDAWLEVDTSPLWLDIICEERDEPPASELPPLPLDTASEAELGAGFAASTDDDEEEDEHSALLLRPERALRQAEPFPLRRRQA